MIKESINALVEGKSLTFEHASGAHVASAGQPRSLPVAVWVIGVIVILGLLMWFFQK